MSANAESHGRGRIRRRFDAIAKIAAAASLLFLIIELAQWPAAEQHRQTLTAELGSIPPVTDARELHAESGSKPDSAIASKNYSSVVVDSEITAHYEQVLRAAGWTLLSRDDTGAVIKRCFGRGDDLASLSVAGTSHPDWRYSISLGWHAFDCK